MIKAWGWKNYWWGFFASHFTTFWTGYGWSSVHFPAILVWLLLALMLLAAYGVYKIFRERKWPKYQLRLLLFLGASFGFFMIMLLFTHSRFPTFKAKDNYPVIIPVALLTLAGWQRLADLKKKFSRSWSLLLLAVILFLVNAVYLIGHVSFRLADRVPWF